MIELPANDDALEKLAPTCQNDNNTLSYFVPKTPTSAISGLKAESFMVMSTVVNTLTNALSLFW